jgi:hypothetical protein
MPWSRKLATPIVLKDGRTIATLGEAREMMLSLSPVRRRTDMWRYTAGLLSAAAGDYSYVPHLDAEEQLTRALMAEGKHRTPGNRLFDQRSR